MLCARGQIAIEFLVLLSVSLIAFGAIFFSANQSLSSQALQSDLASFRHETIQLPAVANRLRFEGDADFLTLTHLPNPSTDFLDVNGQSVSFSTSIESWSFNLGRRVETNLQQPLYPSIYLRVQNGSLRVDSLPFLVSTPRLSVFLEKGESKSVSFLVRNVSSQKLDFTLTLPSIDSMTIVTSDNVFSLSPGETKTISVTIQPLPFVSGPFSKNIILAAHHESTSFSPIEIPLLVSITDQAYLLFYPPVQTVNGSPSALSDSIFTICNTSAETLSNVTFSVSSSISSIVTPPEKLNSLEPGCAETHWSVSFPSTVSTTDGFIQVQSGSIVNAASLSVVSGAS